jgi:hypothetical protein
MPCCRGGSRTEASVSRRPRLVTLIAWTAGLALPICTVNVGPGHRSRLASQLEAGNNQWFVGSLPL